MRFVTRKLQVLPCHQCEWQQTPFSQRTAQRGCGQWFKKTSDAPTKNDIFKCLPRTFWSRDVRIFLVNVIHITSGGDDSQDQSCGHHFDQGHCSIRQHLLGSRPWKLLRSTALFHALTNWEVSQWQAVFKEISGPWLVHSFTEPGHLTPILEKCSECTINWLTHKCWSERRSPFNLKQVLWVHTIKVLYRAWQLTILIWYQRLLVLD